MTMPILPRSFATVPLAHRALHDVADGRPENSRAAIRAAIDAGYGIEMDVIERIKRVFYFARRIAETVESGPGGRPSRLIQPSIAPPR